LPEPDGPTKGSSGWPGIDLPPEDLAAYLVRRLRLIESNLELTLSGLR
jgi:hypothetical protein